MGMAGFAVALTVITTIISPCVYGKEFSDHPDVKVQRRLKQLNKPALKSIKSEDGDKIDPAFDHPLLKNHTIQTRPSFIPKVNSTTEKEDIFRGKSIESFGKKIHDQSNAGGHEVALMNSLGNYYGTQFVMNIWRPEVEVPNEYSLAQTWLGSVYNYKLNTIEVGLQVYPGKYGDNKVRLFVYWTRSKRVTVGGSYCEVSQYDGAQHELPILVWKDCGNWWLRVGEWYKKASYFRKVMTVDGANTLREAENLHPTTDNDNCYSVKEGQSGSSYWGTHFFYGGPGRNAKCP
ncbi:BnaC04g49520D [Brassica napus]|uniref:BnaC04g49520D protein n=1 Tax=Brassica napus TaxID=3708 RepID=A0A078GDH0_BRANA|nr:BnaC04g49520D [Brassica napus]